MLQKIEYQNNPISFDFTNQSEMINATQMAKIFGKIPFEFLENKETKNFILALNEDFLSFHNGSENDKKREFKLGNSQFENSANSEVQYWNSNTEISEFVLKVVRGGRNNGTWMHRLLALKFAAWLDPHFELWIFKTIDNILFGKVKMREDLLALNNEKYELKKQINFEESMLADNKHYNNVKSLKKRYNIVDKKIEALMESQINQETLFE